MTDPKAPTDGRIKTAVLDWDENGQPRSPEFDDVYFSSTDGLAETHHVFLQHNDLATRFSALAELPVDERRFIIGETGFGSGLNFLAAWQLWQTTAPDDAELHFISVEKYPFSLTDLQRTLQLWPELTDYSQSLVQVYPPVTLCGFYRLNFGRVQLTLILNDAATGLEQLLISQHPAFCDQGIKVDAWFLDGFTPARNPDAWTDALFSIISQLSHSETTLATFTSAGPVRRGLRAAGFTTTNVPGFGLKREMLKARFLGLQTSTQQKSTQQKEPALPFRWQGRPPLPWPVVANAQPHKERRALVIGGGLAGCHSARALAERGWQVHLLERHAAPAQEASGNPQGLLYAKLSPKWSPASAFNLLSLTYAQNHYAQFWQRGPEFGAACGLLQLAQSEQEAQAQEQINQRLGDPRLMRSVSAQEASNIAGFQLPHSALYFPHSGWLNPVNICRALIDHPNIQLGTGAEIAELVREGEQWRAVDVTGETLGQAPVAVLANARSALRFAQTSHLPLKAIRGQITELPATRESERLNVALCGEGYVAPSANGIHCTGASFNLKDTNTELTLRDHQSNVENLSGFGPEVAKLFEPLTLEPLTLEPMRLEALAGRVAFRCATPDYLPLVGPAPDREAFLQDYSTLRKDARLDIPTAGRFHPGLFVNVGHGSRGLAYTPLSAALLAAHITGAPSPVGRDLSDALQPGRFLIRDLMRNRI